MTSRAGVIAVLVDPEAPNRQEQLAILAQAARAINVGTLVLNNRDIDTAFATIAEHLKQALCLLPQARTGSTTAIRSSRVRHATRCPRVTSRASYRTQVTGGATEALGEHIAIPANGPIGLRHRAVTHRILQTRNVSIVNARARRGRSHFLACSGCGPNEALHSQAASSLTIVCVRIFSSACSARATVAPSITR